MASTSGVSTRSELNRAEQEYGVPPEIIVGIIGVETRWVG
ncbi:lytic murein transglycosylase [Escherichia coli]